MRPSTSGKRGVRLRAATSSAAWQADMSRRIVESLDAWRDARDSLCEQIFLGVYGSPLVQAAAGQRTSDEPPRRTHPKEPMHQAMFERKIARIEGAHDPRRDPRGGDQRNALHRHGGRLRRTNVGLRSSGRFGRSTARD